MASTDENIGWSEKKANEIWHAAGGFETFTTPVECRMHYCFASVMVGNGEVRNLEVHCKSEKDKNANRPLVLIPPEILREWEQMGVDYEHGDGLFRSRPNGGQRGNPNAQWCLFPAGIEGMSIWARHIKNAVRRLKGGGESRNQREGGECWLVVWNRAKLHVEEFFAKIRGEEGKMSFWLQDEDVREGDKGVIVVREGDGFHRAVYAIFTVTDSPRMMKDTHLEFWKEADKDEEKKRVLVYCDARFDPITEKSIVDDSSLKMESKHMGRRWVRKISRDTYQRVIEQVERRRMAR